MAAKNPAHSFDKWQMFGHVRLGVEDAVECGWSRDAALQILAAAFPGRDTLTLAEARTALASTSGNGAGPRASAKTDDPAALATELVEQIAEYRAERARVAGEHQAIRLAKVNLKKMLKGSEVDIEDVRVLAGELGWAVREDEEGVTVPVNDLIPFFRRPVVRELLAAKMRQVKLGASERDGAGEDPA
jgi:hypothetical protein